MSGTPRPYPSNQNNDAGGSAKEFEAMERQPSSNPTAPLLPSDNPTMQNLEPPPYSSVVAQDSGDWKNRSSSFSTGTTDRPYPPASPNLNAAKSTSGLHNQAPYPTGPPTVPGPVGQSYPSYGPPAQAPYPTGPGPVPQIGTAPYTPGPAGPPGPGFANQAPYPTAGNQAPYPTGPPAMQIGFTAPITTEPHPMNGSERYGLLPMGQGSAIPQQGSNPTYGQGMQGGMVYPNQLGPDNQYIQQSQYAPNQYAQQPPQTVYVVQKNTADDNNDTDSCCLFACCLASCYCLCECIKMCASSDS